MQQNKISSIQPAIFQILPKGLQKTVWIQIALALLGTVLLTLSAKINIAFWPVPTTMQSFVVIMIAVLYGRRLGVATITLYIFEGAMGLPVFANSSWLNAGLSYFFLPSSGYGGYFIGFIISAYVVGMLSEHYKTRTALSAFLIFLTGFIIIDICGLVGLSANFGIHKSLIILSTYQLASVFKIGLGTTLLPLIWKKISFQGN